MTTTERRPSTAEAQRLPWLPLLTRMHRVVDAGVEAAVRAEERRRGARRACRRGCAVCCRHQSDIPAFPIELVGISWYCAERLEDAARQTVRAQLGRHTRGGPCPFLVDDTCAVHPVRPTACRLFTVFGRRCAEGEDPYHERRADLLAPPPPRPDHLGRIRVAPVFTAASITRTRLPQSHAGRLTASASTRRRSSHSC